MMNNDKKYTLGIETTGKIAGVSIICDNKIIAENNIDNGLTHSVTLFNNIYDILNKCNVKISEIDKISVSNGPGSFTGIRIGVAAAIGLSKPYNTKIEYVNTLKGLAYNVKGRAKYIISIMDAKCDRLYTSIYKDSDFSNVLKDQIYTLDEFINKMNKYFANYKNENSNVPNFIFSGDGYIAYSDLLKDKLKIDYVIPDIKDMYQKASSIALCKGDISDITNINYLLKSKAERDKENG